MKNALKRAISPFVKPIAFVKSCYPSCFGVPRQPSLVPSSRGEIVFESYVQPELSLRGLEECSHIWVIFQFHKKEPEKFRAKVRPPRLGGESIGVFASRSPHRPNNIGLSLLKVEEVKEKSIEVSGLDLIEGTPVLDIKPYLPEIEAPEGAHSAFDYNEVLDVDFSDSAEKDLQGWQKLSQLNLKKLIAESLSLDIRSKNYQDKDVFHIELLDADIAFSFSSPKKVLVKSIRY